MTGSVPRNGLLTTSCAGTFSFHLGHSATKETSGLADFPEAPSSPAEMVSGGKMPPHKQRSSGPRAGVQPLPLPPCPTVFSRGGVQLYPTARSHLPPLLASRAAAFRYLVEAPEHLMPGCRPLPPGTPHPTPAPAGHTFLRMIHIGQQPPPLWHFSSHLDPPWGLGYLHQDEGQALCGSTGPGQLPGTPPKVSASGSPIGLGRVWGSEASAAWARLPRGPALFLLP